MGPRSEDDPFEQVTVQQLPQVKHTRMRTNTRPGRYAERLKTVLGLIDYNLFYVKDKTDKALEIAIRLSPKQLDHAVPVFEELLRELVEERQKGARL